MRIETIEIKKNIYIAFDGTEFDEEEQCRLYEGSSFGVILERMKNSILSVTRFEDFIPCAKLGYKCYAIMPKTRSDINGINQILSMSQTPNDDSALSVDSYKLIILSIKIVDNKIFDAFILRPEKIVKELSRGIFSVLCMIKDEKEAEKKEEPIKK